jgi:NAD(P)-dependent dehydrogenase (short-subunit alcohol dehydrogenase family)
MTMSNRLAGKVAIVTGAGTVAEGMGNGKATALLFAREGARIAAVDLNRAAAETTAEDIRKEGGAAIALAGDVSRSADVRGIVDATAAHFGRIDVLHNNVGIEIAGDPVSTTEEDWDRVHEVNLKGPFLMCKYTIPHMERQGGGAIINISSVASLRWSPVPYFPYHTSKAALNHMTRVIARQYAAKNIRCNVILPGMIDTPHVRHYYRDRSSEEVEQVMRRRDQACPMGRQGNPWDIARAALFLASDDAGYVTGVELVVDGGLTL